MYLFVKAANMGSESACCTLGDAFAYGRYGLDLDEAEARIWFEKMATSSVKDTSESYRGRAKQWMEEHAKRAAGETTGGPVPGGP